MKFKFEEALSKKTLLGIDKSVLVFYYKQQHKGHPLNRGGSCEVTSQGCRPVKRRGLCMKTRKVYVKPSMKKLGLLRKLTQFSF